jgi:hypothetical protein
METGIKQLVGKTIVDIKNIDNRELRFTTKEGDVYCMYHRQDCCESVHIESIGGDLDDLLNCKVLVAEEKSNREENYPDPDDSYCDGTFTWTFYTIATIKGYVDIRWYGSSNGYYSESVSFELLEPTSKD